MQEDLYQLVVANRPLLECGDENLQQLDEKAVVETILNFGTLKSVKALFEVVGLAKVASIFYEQIAQPRTNYYPKVKNYFDLYFKRHVHQYS